MMVFDEHTNTLISERLYKTGKGSELHVALNLAVAQINRDATYDYHGIDRTLTLDDEHADRLADLYKHNREMPAYRTGSAVLHVIPNEMLASA